MTPKTPPERLSGLLDVSDIEAGLQTTAWLAPGISGAAASRAAQERGVDVVPLSRHASQPLERDGLQLGFAAVDAREIRRGMRELAIALEEGVRRPSRSVRHAAKAN